MKSLLDYLTAYESYHQHPSNRAIHALGIPIMVTSVGLMLTCLYLPIGNMHLSVLMILILALLIFYYRLDLTLGIIFTFIYPGLVWICELILAQTSVLFTGLLGFGLFLFSLVIQLYGHKLEGKRPASTDNAVLFFIAPLYHVIEIFFLLGWRKALQKELHQRLSQKK